jgi:hypothetical protein
MNAVPPPKLYKRRAGVVLFEDRNDLRLAESRLPHEGLLSACGRETNGFKWPGLAGQRRNP